MATALPLLLRLALAALVGAVLWATHAAGVQTGRSAVLADWNAEKARTAQGTATAATQALQHSAALGDTLAQLITDHQKAKANDNQALATLLAGVRAGTVRLSVPTREPAAGAGAALPGATPAQPGQARAELAPQAAANLVAIAGDGDDATHDLNTCLDAYDAARARVNAAAGHAPPSNAAQP